MFTHQKNKYLENSTIKWSADTGLNHEMDDLRKTCVMWRGVANDDPIYYGGTYFYLRNPKRSTSWIDEDEKTKCKWKHNNKHPLSTFTQKIKRHHLLALGRSICQPQEPSGKIRIYRRLYITRFEFRFAYQLSPYGPFYMLAFIATRMCCCTHAGVVIWTICAHFELDWQGVDNVMNVGHVRAPTSIR